MSEDTAVMLSHFNTSACRMFRAVTKLVDFGDDAVQKCPQLLEKKPEGSVTDGRDKGETCPLDVDSMKAETSPIVDCGDLKGCCRDGNIRNFVVMNQSSIYRETGVRIDKGRSLQRHNNRKVAVLMTDTVQVEETEVFVSEINTDIDSDVETLRRKMEQDVEDKITDITKCDLCGIFRNLYAVAHIF